MIAVTIAVWLWPARFGGDTTVLRVQGTSMEPSFHDGDLVIARAHDRYRTGDIVVFRVPGARGRSSNMVHRIIAVHDDGTVTTRGDNRDTADGFRTSTQDILGRATWQIEHGATVLLILSRWWLLAIFTGALVTARLWSTDDEQRAGPPAGAHPAPDIDAVRGSPSGSVDRRDLRS